jgi:hypothetical protein
MRYRVEIRDPIGNAIRIDTGTVSSKGGEFTYDFRGPGIVPGGGAIIGVVVIEWGEEKNDTIPDDDTTTKPCLHPNHPFFPDKYLFPKANPNWRK